MSLYERLELTSSEEIVLRINGTIYADYQAATPVDPRVIDVMTGAMRHLFANPHSQHHVLGWQAAQAIEEAAQYVSALVGAAPEEIIFTSGATEANAMAVSVATYIAARSERDTIVMSEGDHNSLRVAAHASHLNVIEVPLDRFGKPDLEVCENVISERTALVSVVGVNNENGAIADLEKIGAMAAKKRAIFHADLAQAPLACAVMMERAKLGCATLSSHKLYGPKGIGAFVIARELRDLVQPLIRGAGQQEGKRGGTVPTELCLGFGEACRLITENHPNERDRVAEVRDTFVTAIESASCGELLGPRARRHPGNALLRFPGHSATDLMGRLQTVIAASTQAACSTGSIEPSHVLLAMGLTRQEAAECVRFSFGRFSDQEQAREAAAVVIRMLKVSDGQHAGDG